MTVRPLNPTSAGSDGRTARSVLMARQHFNATRLREAEALCRRALEEDENYGAALHLLGLITGRTGRLPESADLLRRAVKSCPNTAEFRNDLGVTLERLGDFRGAVECYRRVLAAAGDAETRRHGDPGSVAQTWTNLANALLHSEKTGEAKEACERAIGISPRYAPAHNALGCILLEQNMAVEACAAFRKAIEIKKDYPEAGSNLGRALLTLGEFGEGWPLFEYLHTSRMPRHAGRSLAELIEEADKETRRPGDKETGGYSGLSPQHSALLADKTVLLYGEGGLGNIIQFARYATLLAERGARVVFESPAALVKLLRTVPGIEQVIADGEAPPPFHAHASIMSLPRILGTTLDTIPATVPYISADSALVQHWGRELEKYCGAGFPACAGVNVQAGKPAPQERAGELSPVERLKRAAPQTAGQGGQSAIGNRQSQICTWVGIAWQAEQRTLYGRQRSIPLGHFAVLSQVPGVKLISLQKGWSGSSAFPIAAFSDLDGGEGAFMDTAAIMKHLDLVITADTSIAHVAGALGVPVWAALRHTPDWRWMLERSDSPWYPTVRLFRQKTPGVWREVFEEMAGELKGFAREDRGAKDGSTDEWIGSHAGA